jgi:hypothetical protein
MPWLVTPGHCVSLHDAAIHRVPLPEDAAAAVCRGSFGDWLALVPPTGRRPFLLNAFTMERIKLPRLKKNPMVKLVLSSAPDSKSCRVAAIVEDEYYRMRSKIAVCHVGRGALGGPSLVGSSSMTSYSSRGNSMRSTRKPASTSSKISTYDIVSRRGGHPSIWSGTSVWAMPSCIWLSSMGG